jgi:hypothetical protein
MVRSRTPKITLHTEEAKCILYDTSPDFESQFYVGTKLHISKEGTIKITNIDGTTITLDSNSRSTCLSSDIQDMLEKTQKWQKFCLEEELIREKRKEIYSEIISFPLTIGRKPHLINANKVSFVSSGFLQPSNLVSMNQHQLSSSHPNLALIGGSSNDPSMLSYNNINNQINNNKLTKTINCDDEFTNAYLRSASTNSLNGSFNNSCGAINFALPITPTTSDYRLYQQNQINESKKSLLSHANNSSVKPNNLPQDHTAEEMVQLSGEMAINSIPNAVNSLINRQNSLHLSSALSYTHDEISSFSQHASQPQFEVGYFNNKINQHNLYNISVPYQEQHNTQMTKLKR